ncbi:MAG: DUF4870 domain-containing protein [Planctomycetota bacterium]
MDEPNPIPDPNAQAQGDSVVPVNNTYFVLLHVLPLAGIVVPVGNVIIPLVMWLLKKDESPQVDAHGREVLAFQLSYLIYGVVAGILIVVIIGMILVPLVMLAWLILTIVGTIKAADGILYRYPGTIRFFGSREA